MKVNEVFPDTSKSLRAADLQGNEASVVISSYSIQNFGKNGADESKPVLTFEGKEKTLVLNKTNARCIEAAYGDELDDWIGKPIIMFPTKTDFGGDMVDCIRVRIPAGSEDVPF